MNYKKYWLGALALLAASFPVHGRAFYSAQNSASFMAMSGASMTIVRNADVAANNPAGMVRLNPGFYLTAGGASVETEYMWEGQDSQGRFASETTENPPLISPHFHLAWKPIKGKWAFGLATKLPYNNILSWDSSWEGRERAIDTRLLSIAFNPVAAYAINDNHSIAFGVSFAPTRLQTNARQPFDTGNYRVDVKGNSVFYNVSYLGNVGRFYTAMQYNSTMRVKMDGTIKFTQHNNPAFQSGPLQLNDSDVSADFDLPWIFEASIGWKDQVDNPRLEVEAGFFRMGWSVYKRIRFSLDEGSPGLATQYGRDNRIDIPTNYYDSNNYRAGLAFHATDSAILMMGFERDQDVTPKRYRDPAMPLGGETNFAIGGEFKVNPNASVGIEANVSLWDRVTTDNTTSIVDVSSGGRRFNGTYEGMSRLTTFSYNQSF